MFTLFLPPQNTNETRYRKTVSAFVLSGELSVLRCFQCPKEEQQLEPFPRVWASLLCSWNSFQDPFHLCTAEHLLQHPSLPSTCPLNVFIVRSFIYITSINTPPDLPKAMSIPDVILNMSNLSFITTSTFCLNSTELPPQASTSPLDLCSQINVQKRGVCRN